MGLISHLKWPLAATAVSTVLSFVLFGVDDTSVLIILTILEISLSFDNAVVNAKILRRMSPYWQKLFLTVGILIAVFGMRLVFPLLIVGITASLGPLEAIKLAGEGGSIHEPGTYAYLLHEAHPQIAAFGGMFLLMLVLDFLFKDRDIQWLVWLERPLARIGKLDQLSVVIAASALCLTAKLLADDPAAVLLAGVLGLVTYLLVNGLGELFESDVALATGRAGLFLFIYIEILDASFSFDGVIGAFAISNNVFLIAAGLGLGALYIRSLTVYFVHENTLDKLRYLEHGAHWAIGALACIMLVSIRYEVPEIVTGLIGVAFIAGAYLHSKIANKRDVDAGVELEHVV